MEKNSVNLSKNRWKTAGLFVLFFLTFLLILHSLPLSLDDYGFLNEHFASTSQALHYVLTFGNGRFLGNSGIIFLMHHLVLGDVIRAYPVTFDVFTAHDCTRYFWTGLFLDERLSKLCPATSAPVADASADTGERQMWPVNKNTPRGAGFPACCLHAVLH